MTVSPDNGQGGRGGFLAIEHTNGGINLVSQGSYVDEAGELDWAVTPVATGLDPSKPHTVKLKLVKKPDTKKSTNNDVFSVQVDGKPVKNTTFEAYYEATGEQNYQTDTLHVPPQRHRAAAVRRRQGPADRRRHHRDLLTPAQHLPKQSSPSRFGGTGCHAGIARPDQSTTADPRGQQPVRPGGRTAFAGPTARRTTPGVFRAGGGLVLSSGSRVTVSL